MYKGLRDSMLGIIVPQDCCHLFTDNNKTEWVEVFIPPKDVSKMCQPWSSIAVPPSQVCFVDDVYNEIFVNAGAELTCLYKEWNTDGTRRVVGSEKEIVEFILARFLQYERYKKYGMMTGYVNLNILEHDYQVSGLKMIEYIRRHC